MKKYLLASILTFISLFSVNLGAQEVDSLTCECEILDNTDGQHDGEWDTCWEQTYLGEPHYGQYAVAASCVDDTVPSNCEWWSGSPNPDFICCYY